MTRSWRNLLFSFIATSLLVEIPASASNRYLTYQGRIKKLTGEPLEESSVRFRFEITNPTGTCVIYQELSAPINMTNSDGVFDIAIGSGAATVADGSINIETTFQNERSFNCVGGGVYNAVAGHSRLLRVSFLDSEGWHTLTSDSEIRGVPFASFAQNAASANRLGTASETDFLKISNIPTCAAGTFLRHVAPTGTLVCEAIGSVSGGSVSGNITGNAAGFTGSLAGDVTGTQSATSVDRVKGIPVNAGAAADGKVLKYSSGSLVFADDNEGTLTIADGSITDAKIDSITSAGKVSGSAITSGIIGGSTAINTSGLIQTNNGVRLYSGSNFVELKAATTPSGDYTLRFPAAAGSNGQVLKTDASGNLYWANDDAGAGGGGTVTTVSSANSYITVTDGNTTPTITAVVGTTANTLAAGDDSRFTNARTPTGSASGDLAGSYPNPTVAAIRGNAVGTGTIPGADIGKVYRWNGTELAPAFLNFGDLRTAGGAQQLAASCAANEKIQWSVITDTFTCQAIGSLDASAITAGTLPISRGGTGSTDGSITGSGSLTFTAGGTNQNITLSPSGTGSTIMNNAVLNGITTLPFGGSSATPTLTFAGDPDTGISSLSANTINFSAQGVNRFQVGNGGVGSYVAFSSTVSIRAPIYYGSNAASGNMTLDSTSDATKGNIILNPTAGNVGVGVASPTSKLEVAGVIHSTTGGIKFPDGTTQTTAATGGGSGTVTSVSSANSYLTIANGSTTPTITAVVGTTVNTLAAGDDSRFTDARAPTGSAGGDLSGSYPNPGVAAIRGNAVSAGTIPGADIGKVYRWNGTSLAPAFLNFGDLRTAAGAQQLATSCAANEKIQWSVITDTFSCEAIGSLNASAITAGTIDTARLPASVKYWEAATGGINYAGGNVGIGTTDPGNKLHVVDEWDAGIKFSMFRSYPADIRIFKGRGTPAAPTAVLSGDFLGGLQFYGYSSSATPTQRTAAIDVLATENFTASARGSAITFKTTTNGTTTSAERLRISDSGNVGIGTTAPGSPLDVVGRIRSTSTNAHGVIETKVIGDDTNFSPHFVLRRARGTEAAPEYLQNGDRIGILTFRDNTAPQGASIVSTSTENHSASALGASLNFYTIPNGTATPVSKVTISDSGNVGMGSAAPETTLHLANTTGNPLLIDAYGDAVAPTIMTRRSRGSDASPTAVLAGDLLGGAFAKGHNGTDFPSSGNISLRFVASENFTSSANGTYMIFQTTNNGSTAQSEKMRLTHNGRLGIGTSDPQAPLHITHSNAEKLILSDPDYPLTDVNFSGFIRARDKNGDTAWYLGDGSTASNILTLLTYGDTPMRFSTNSTTRLYIDEVGNVGVGTTAPDQRFVVNNGSTIGRYTTGGWTHSSDRRLKTDIKSLDRGLASILELKPVSYQYSLDPNHTQQIGFIAQDVEKIFPEVVVNGNDGYKSMIYANLVAPIVKALQELAALVENKAERSEVEALKAENAAMKEYLCQKDPQAPFCKK